MVWSKATVNYFRLKSILVFNINEAIINLFVLPSLRKSTVWSLGNVMSVSSLDSTSIAVP
jgi:hypothetical protein